MGTNSWNAVDYEKNAAPQREWARELVAKLNLQGHESLLDIGCGDGKITAGLAGDLPGGSAVGIDSSEGMIELAQARYPTRDFPNLRFLQMDASSLPFQDEFDVVFSNAALHWIRDHRPVLQGISRSLRSGGRILLQMGGRHNGAEIFGVLEEVIQSDQWRGYFHDFTFPWAFYGPEQYRPWLGEAGLSPLRIELLPKDMTHDGPTGLAGWIRTTWLPYTQRVPDSKREGFIQEIVARYLQRFPADENGRTHVRMVRLEVEAEKRS